LVHPNSVFVRWISHALGDNLLLSVILPELRNKYPNKRIIVETKFPDLFLNNPNIDWVTDKHFKTTKKFIKPKYRIFLDTTKPIIEQMLEYVSEKKVEYPQIFLSKNEIEKYRKDYKYFTITPIGKQAFHANRKEWGFEKFQKVVKLIKENSDFKFVQLGSSSDKLLEGVIDNRGLPIRDSAAVIKNSVGFIGLEGGVMHIAKAVNIDSVIIFGGFLNPKVTQYDSNINIVNLVECSPCLTSEEPLTHCDSMKCMNEISPEYVFNKIKEEYLVSK
jgi:ADP-heptose:LPS heptosyltransferase